MIRTSYLGWYTLFALALSGCSIDVAQPTMSTPSLSASPTLPGNPGNATPSVVNTNIPVTWAGLNLTGSLLYASVPLTDITPVSIQKLDLITGEINTVFTTTGDAWVYYMTVSPDGKQLVMSYAPPSEGITLSNRALYTMTLDGTA